MINNLLKNFCLIVFVNSSYTLLLVEFKKFKSKSVSRNSKEIILSSNTFLYSFPEVNAKQLLNLDKGTTLLVLRNWKVSESEIWVRVELPSNKLLDDPNMITKGWLKM